MDKQDFQKDIDELKQWMHDMESSTSIHVKVDHALQGRGFLKSSPNNMFVRSPNSSGILQGNGSIVSAIVPLSGTHIYYVSDSSGGAVTRKLTFTNGVLVSQT